MSGHKRETTPKILRLVPDTLDGILQHFFAKISKKMAKIVSLLLWQQCKVQLADIYENQIMSILYWTFHIEHSNIFYIRLFKGSRDALKGKAT